MPKTRLPLYSKILLGALLNLALLGLLGALYASTQFGFGLDWILAGPAGKRLEQLGENITFTLRNAPEETWDAELARQEAELGLKLLLYGNDGRQLGGSPVPAPPELMPRLVDKRTPADMPPPPRPGRAKENRPTPAKDTPPKPRFMIKAGKPARYWAGIHLTLAKGRGPERRPLTLVVLSDSITGNGIFLDARPWLVLVLVALGVSAIIWLPLLAGITRIIRRTNDASKLIAQGKFDVRLPEHRRDELGELATSVNAMAAQLGDLVARQRQITRDVAHELCSPISRMQMALGVVEQNSTPTQARYLQKLDAELQHMARLVEEVLTFSKLEGRAHAAASEEVHLAGLLAEIIQHEGGETCVELDAPAEIQVRTDRGNLERALRNLVRNAIRYAAPMGPVRVSASQDEGATRIWVRDEGPGVPPELLPRLFEPFFRPEPSRGRQLGGSGLGLAIAKRCVESCGGQILLRLRSPHGLEAEIVLPSRC